MNTKLPVLLVLFFILGFYCFAEEGDADFDYERHFKAISTNTVILVHVMNNPVSNDLPADVKAGDLLGAIEGFPEKLSDKNNEQMKKMEKLYNERKYKEAAEILDSLWETENKNPLYLFFLGRTYYRFQGAEEGCISTFERVIEISEKNASSQNKVTFQPKNNDAQKPKIIMDFWYVDAYWKLGILYFNTGQYQKSILQLTKALYLNRLMLDDSNIKTYEIMLVWLAKGYKAIGDKEAARYYAKQALKINPNNSDMKDL